MIIWTDVFSWTWLGWYVALLLGIWGALLGTSDFKLASAIFLLTAALASAKWAHFTKNEWRLRNFKTLVVGEVAVIVITTIVLTWMNHKRRESLKLETERKVQATQIDELGKKLTLQAEEIASLQKEIEEKTKIIRDEVSGTGMVTVAPFIDGFDPNKGYPLFVLSSKHANIFDLVLKIGGPDGAINNCSVGRAYARQNKIVDCWVGVPPEGGFCAITIIDRRGVLLYERILFRPSPSGRMESAINYLDIHGMEIARRDIPDF